jgi:peroxiredoxin
MLAPSSPKKFKIFSAVAGVALLALAAAFFVNLSSQAQVPDVTFTNLKGEKISTQSLRGKVVIVDFWATSCATCVAEMPRMIDTFNKYNKQGLEFVAVAMREDQPNYVVNYAETRKLPFQVALDIQGSLAQAFGHVQMTPTTFVIDKQGHILKRYLGEPSFPELQQLLEKALAAQA